MNHDHSYAVKEGLLQGSTPVCLGAVSNVEGESTTELLEPHENYLMLKLPSTEKCVYVVTDSDQECLKTSFDFVHTTNYVEKEKKFKVCISNISDNIVFIRDQTKSRNTFVPARQAGVENCEFQIQENIPNCGKRNHNVLEGEILQDTNHNIGDYSTKGAKWRNFLRVLIHSTYCRYVMYITTANVCP